MGLAMAFKNHRWLALMGLIVVTACIFLQVTSNNTHFSGALGRLDAVLYDWRFKLLPPQRKALPEIVIVDLDEFTQKREGRWPWDRAKVGQLIDVLREQGAVIIGFDVVFSEKGTNPARQLLAMDTLPEQIRHALSANEKKFDGDAALVNSLDPFVVLGYFFHEDGVKVGKLPPPFLLLPPGGEQKSTLQALPDYTASLPLLMNAGASSGFVVAIPDADGIIRRVPLVLRHDDGVYTSLSLEMARLALNAPWIRLGTEQHDRQDIATHIQIGKHVQIPLDESGNMLVPYRGKVGSYRTISATRVLRQDGTEEEKAALNNAIVFVGTSALGLSDLRTIPLQTAYPGVEVHANALDAMLQAALGEDTLYYQPDWAIGATTVVLAVLGVFLILVLPGTTPRTMLALTFLCLAGVLGANGALWYYAHMALPLASLLILVFSLMLLNIAAGYWLSNHQKQSMQRLFGEYVPPSYVDKMLKHPEAVNLSGEQRDMTVLFADVRSFTAISEHLSAAALKDLLNRYLSSVTEVIFAHQGTIDKYVGDMVMAFWNAPLDDQAHAAHAVATALDMQLCMQRLREKFVMEGLPQLRIGIGLNTGSMNVGDMGSNYRRAYTVLGDAVNLGSRLESLTAFYQVAILVGPLTKEQAPDFVYRPVDLIRVKGKKDAVEVFEPLCREEEASPALRERVMRLEQAIACYRRKDWHDATTLFRQLRQEDPGSAHLYDVYLSRMDEEDLAALPADWDAVYSHLGK